MNDGIQRKIGPWEINVSGGNVGIQRKSSRDKKKKRSECDEQREFIRGLILNLFTLSYLRFLNL